MSESIPISDAKKMRSGVNVEAEVIGKGEPSVMQQYQTVMELKKTK